MSARTSLKSVGRTVIAAATAWGIPVTVRTQSTGVVPTPPAAAARVPRRTIALDGHLREPAWAAAGPVADFRQYDPDVGAPATERTEVRVLFDSATLYVGVLALDSRPGALVSRILARDQLMVVDAFTGQLNFAGDDAVAVLLDPFRDRRNAVVFATNPNGAEFDAQVTDQGRQVNVAWRTAWRVAATRTDSGWSAEFAIPLRSIRHPDDGRDWGFNVYRIIRRKNEHALWRSWSRDNAGFLKVSEAGALPGIAGLAREGTGLEVRTSAIGRAVHGDVDGRRTPADGSLDIKYEVRPGVTFDATANTDFAQADVDDVRINLTRFSLFFPEKRDFFLENAGVFEFGVPGTFEPPPWLMFFSRRIGISDSGEIPVLGGVRLTGREGRQTFGALHMRTQRAFDQSPAAYSVARFKRDVGSGGYVGAMYSGLENRRPDPLAAPTPPVPTVPAMAHTYGTDFQYWPTSTTNVQGFVAQVAGGNADGAGSRDRTAYRLLMDRQVERWGLRLDRMIFGSAADPEMGFATRTDIARQDAIVRLTFRPRITGVRRLEIYNFASYITRRDGGLQDRGVGPAFSLNLNSGEDFTVYHLESRTVLDDPFDLADRLPIAPGAYANAQTGFFINTANRRPVSVSVNGQRQQFYGGTLLFVNGTLSIAMGSRGLLALTRAYNDAEVPSGRLVTNVSAVRAAFAFSTRANVSTTAQYNALDRVLSVNARYVYTYRPGSEIFLVINSERERGVPPALRPRTALLKLTYLALL